MPINNQYYVGLPQIRSQRSQISKVFDNIMAQIISLEEGKAKLKQAFDKIAKGTDGGSDFRAGYTLVFIMCTQRTPNNWSSDLYSFFKETISTFIQNQLKDNGDEAECLRKISKIVRIFIYLDRYHVKYNQLQTLADVAKEAFTKVASTLGTNASTEINNMQRGDFKLKLHEKGGYALMCGAGVSIAICPSMETWSAFLKSYAQKTKEILELDDKWMRTFNDLQDTALMERTEYIVNALNGLAGDELEKHRMLAQLLLRNPPLVEPGITRAKTLHNLGQLILTTNFDTVIEDCVPKERISMSHVEFLKYLPLDLSNLFPSGSFFSDPYQRFVVHLHGRFFDIGRDHGFCLTPSEYNDPKTLTPFMEFMEIIIRSKSLVFIGASKTLEDVHFSSLWSKFDEWSITNEQYILHHKEELSTVESMVKRIMGYNAVKFVLVEYGDNRDDLWHYLAEESTF